MILSEWVKLSSGLLERAGIENAKNEPFRWLSYMSGKNRAFFLSRTREPIEELFTLSEVERLEKICSRRQKNEPLAYILGTTGFWGHEFLVGPGVLIPRSDSERIVEAALGAFGILPFPSGQLIHTEMPELSGKTSTPGTVRFMDLCTGSGCLGISLTLAFLEKGISVKGILTDISPDALKYADQNIQMHSLQNALMLSSCDLFPEISEISDFWGQPEADLIVVNPPYITDNDMSGLMPEVADYEPQIALRGGEDGLDFYRRILVEAQPFLASGGLLIMEHGCDQGESVPALCRAYGYLHEQSFRDYGGKPRVTAARKP